MIALSLATQDVSVVWVSPPPPEAAAGTRIVLSWRVISAYEPVWTGLDFDRRNPPNQFVAPVSIEAGSRLFSTEITVPATGGYWYFQAEVALGFLLPGAKTGVAALWVTAPPPPSNDDYPGPALSGANVAVTGNSLGATALPGEPRPAWYAGYASVWWNWTAPSDGRAIVRTDGSAFDTVVGVYVGAFSGVHQGVGWADFQASAGTTYFIQVNGYYGQGGPIRLSVSLEPPETPAAPPDDEPSESTCGLVGADALLALLALKSAGHSRTRRGSS